MLRKRSVVLITVCGLLGVVLAATHLPAELERVARRDVLSKAQGFSEWGKTPRISGAKVTLSLRHGALVVCKLENVGEFSKAVWYAWPWRKVIFEK